jgi:YesN/AraC family two-component response regulator
MKRVVIVDDELSSKELLVNLIHKYRFPMEIVGLASDGEEALQVICELRPDIVFLDIQMPVKNGLDVMNELRSLSYGEQRHTPKVIIITAYRQFEYAQTALRLGAKDYLLKPIDYRQLYDTLQRVLGYWYTDNPSFNKLLECIDTNYAQNLSLQDYANYIHVSPGYITRLLNKYLGMGFKEWINEVRIKKAIELLEITDLSIKSISDKVGYNNLNYFYRKFRAITSTTPKNYRS